VMLVRIVYLAICFLFVPVALAKDLNILVTINPIYSLITNITKNSGNTELLIRGNSSPHDYQLKPSDIKKIKNADIIFMIDGDFEVFLAKYLAKNTIKAKVIKIIEFPNLVTLPARNIKVLNVVEDGHDDDQDHHHDHKAHEHCSHNVDMHIWASPLNAQIMVHEAASILSEYNPDRKNYYQKNAQSTIEKLRVLDKEIAKILDKKIQQKPFIVFHDGYQYFEQQYHLNNVGVVAGNNFVYGPKTMKRLRENIEEYNIKCIFAEPQFSDYLMQKVAKTTGTKLGYIDIEWGTFGEPVASEDLYFFMMKRDAENIRACLS